MCFPCLGRNKKLNSTESSSAEFDDCFEYIVDKYTIRKIPLYPMETCHDLRDKSAQEEQQCEAKESVPQETVPQEKDPVGEFAKLTVLPEMAYSVPIVTSVMPVTTHSVRSVKEKPRPEDILDSTSQIPRRPVTKPNYVAIPSKASIQAKDIMLTKREITSQYLNNFSSVFIDNLKDQVPKDPQTLPKLGRPYTSALKNMPMSGIMGKSRRKSDCKSKVHKLVYALPDGKIVETDVDANEGEISPSDEESPRPVQSSDWTRPESRPKEQSELSTNSKGTLKRQSSWSEADEICRGSRPPSSSFAPSTSSSKHITYEQIQALDVGYEFSNSEKHGVKPKMTRIRITNMDADRNKDASTRPDHVSRIDSLKSRTAPTFQAERTRSQSHNSRVQTHRPDVLPQSDVPDENSDDQRRRVKYFTEERFPPQSPGLAVKINVQRDSKSCLSFTEDSQKTDSEAGNILIYNNKENRKTETDCETIYAELNRDRVRSPMMVKACMQATARPNSVSSERSGTCFLRQRGFPQCDGCPQPHKNTMACKSRSFDSISSTKKEEPEIAKAFPVPHFEEAEKREEEPETETTNSLYSRDSKTSTMVTSPLTSELYVAKKPTVRWKITIKHHKDDQRENGMPMAGSHLRP